MDTPISDRKRLAALYVPYPTFEPLSKTPPSLLILPDLGTGFVPVAKRQTSSVYPTLLREAQASKL